ncbi:hypothetical protein N7G274_008492 [Stereocaulon virgatum]|uniref:Glutamyl-tRNA(Gln) amidotransferase subunit A, mitochondrial n=1 Tax=Stereocaulon virgatum TaxID=373712 RepID=A0ABR4A1U9_9LECA
MSLLRKAERCFANQHAHKLLNAFVGAAKDVALFQHELQAANERSKEGRAKSPIDGHLIAIKDNICTTGEPTTCASAILEGFHSPYPATVVEKLKGTGALIIGKTNLDEFGMGSHSTNSIYGPVKNIYTQDGDHLSAGGSSGGSAVAVATGQCDAALGTDTGGSVRLPAAYTGIVGFKPSYGLVSRWGVVAYANSLDTVGVLAKDSSVARSVFNVINGHDPRDPTSLSTSTRSRIEKYVIDRSAKHLWGASPLLRIGVPIEYNTEELQPTVKEAWLGTLQRLQQLGHTIHILSLPATKMALSAYYVLAPAEASSNLAKYDGVRYGNKSAEREGTDNVLYAATRGSGLGEEVKRRILLGSYSLSAAAIDNYFIKAQKVRRLVQRDFNNAFALSHPLLDEQAISSTEDKVDIILTPTAQSMPPKLDDLDTADPLEAYKADVMTVPASLAGLPAMSVPVSEEPSIGMQIIAQYGDDDLIFDFAQIIESL